MKHLKKPVFIALSSMLILNHASAQSAKDMMFHSIGWSVYTDYMRSPATVVSFTNPDGSISKYGYQNSGIALATFIYNFRYNLTEPSSNMAISLNAIPALGATISTNTSSGDGGDDAGFGSFNFPVMVGAEFGAGSTYNSTANIGGFFHIGYEFTVMPLFGGSTASGGSGEPTPDYKKSWGEPVMAIGVRYWNHNNKLREINIKYGFGSSAPAGTLTDGSDLGSALSIRLSWLIFLNY